MNSALLRTRFLEYFKRHNHALVASSSIIPGQDPTILFTNAGMNQFKDLFLGNEQRSYRRAASSQKCVRAGGKHNDLDQVGFTDRHLTFFEMLGNFSFGDYFKKEAIAFAWEFLTKDIGIPVEKLSVTVHYSDQESADIWHQEIGLPKEKISFLGDDDNFWQMGDVGPCGPCTEIFYDRGAAYEASGTRFLEIWNLVFMQYQQTEGGVRKPLAQTGVDTGMGLERLALVLQNGKNIFDTDLFKPLIAALETMSGYTYAEQSPAMQAAFHVVADHVRSSSMILADGGRPSNEGRGYVLRKIIRRGLLFAQKLGDLNFFRNLVPHLLPILEASYPELGAQVKIISDILQQETERFAENLVRGQSLLNGQIQLLKKDGKHLLDGQQAFKLYDTYGFPLEITHILCNEQGMQVDVDGFTAAMEKQRELSAAGGQKNKVVLELPEGIDSRFVGYQDTYASSIVVWSQYQDGLCFVATESTPFFVECGGQVSDQGWVIINEERCKVEYLQKIPTGKLTSAIVVGIKFDGQLAIGQSVELQVDQQLRANTAKNHTGTHVLQAALQYVLGKQAQQAGSLVHPDYLRFSFTHHQALSAEEIAKVEEVANAWIWQNDEVSVCYTSLQDANEQGAMALFGEKYNPELVRMVKIGAFSTELCGGTHLQRSGEIGCLKIVSEESVGVGVRSIVALTGPKALQLFQNQSTVVEHLCQRFAVQPDKVLEAIDKLADKMSSLNKQVEQLKHQQAEQWAEKLMSEAFAIGNNRFILASLPNMDLNFLKNVVQLVGKKSRCTVTFLSSTTSNGPIFVAETTADLQPLVNLQNLAKALMEIGCKGGGKPASIQGGGKLDVDLGQMEALVSEFMRGCLE